MSMSRLLNAALLLSLGCAVSYAQNARAARKAAAYPLRLHVLAIDDAHPTVRLQPNWCSLTVADVGNTPGTAGGGADPCANSGSMGFGGDDDFSGAGRADLVTPPSGTQALSFTYEGCSRMRIPSGFQGLSARWKKPEKKLEVLVPTDAIVAADRPLPTEKCTVTVTMRDFVYLRLRSGSLVEVTQEAYFNRPALRRFLSGGAQTLETRSPPVVSVRELEKPQQ
jgi:hypothetical protein